MAADWMGWKTVLQCEIDSFCQKILKYHWPNATLYSNVKTTDFSIHRGTIDVLSFGFPCQPASTAGARKGLDDDRWLWPEMRRAYREIRPRIIEAENVTGLLSILEPASITQLENKKIDGLSEGESIQRRAIATIIADLEEDRYSVPVLSDGTPIICAIPACGVNAPHKRERIWIVAYADDHRGCGRPGEIQMANGEVSEWNNDAESGNASDGVAADDNQRDGTEIGLQAGRQVDVRESFGQSLHYPLYNCQSGN